MGRKLDMRNFSPDDYDEALYLCQEIKVDAGQTPLRIDKFLNDRLQRATRNRIQNAIKAGSITVNREEVKSNYKVRPHDLIRVLIPKPPGERTHLIPQNIPLDVVYEDPDVLIINKPVGMVVHPGIGHRTRTLVNALAYYYQERPLPVLRGNQPDRPGLVHRIDKNTSGLMVVAKNEYALNHLAKQFYQHTIQRRYHALVWGNFEQDHGTIVAHVGRDNRKRTAMKAYPEGEEGKWAVTHYRVLEDLYYVSLVECELETGRTHQIRVHVQHSGHPLFNDEKYGGDRILKGTPFNKYRYFVDDCFSIMPRHALHAKVLGFTHPATGKEMYFESDLPADFQQVLDRWRRYVEGRKRVIESER